MILDSGPPPHIELALSEWKKTGRGFSIATRGSSMIPFIREGDRLSIQPSAPGQVRIGSVFAFWQGSTVIVHRCIWRRRMEGAWWFCQKGDNTGEWSWVNEAQVIGLAGPGQPAHGTAWSHVYWVLGIFKTLVHKLRRHMF